MSIKGKAITRIKELECTYELIPTSFDNITRQVYYDGRKFQIEVFMPINKEYDGCHSLICHNWHDVIDRLNHVNQFEDCDINCDCRE